MQKKIFKKVIFTIITSIMLVCFSMFFYKSYASTEQVDGIVTLIHEIEKVNEVSYIKDIKEETKVSEVKENIPLPEYYQVEVNDINGTILTNTQNIGTGSTITIKNQNNETLKSYTVIVKGDITGEGIVNFVDIIRLIQYVYNPEENFEWKEEIRQAGKVAGELGNPNFADIIRIIRYCYDGFDWEEEKEKQNDKTAEIKFEEEGVRTSEIGMTPYNKNNPSTYSQATGRANYNIIKARLNNKEQIDVNGEYYLEGYNGAQNHVLDLEEGDTVRIRGVGQTHKFIFKNLNGNVLFGFENGIKLYVSNIDFETIPEDIRNNSTIFRYYKGNYHTDEIIIRDCTFTDINRILEIVATPDDLNEREYPSNQIIDKIVIHNNIISNAIAPTIIDVVDPYVKEFRVTDNTIRNSGWVFVYFINDNASNSGEISIHNRATRQSLFYIDNNNYINNDDFDMMLEWHKARYENPPITERSEWVSLMYFSPVVHKGAEDIRFTNNHIEGIHTKFGDNTPELYNSYLSGHRLLYENNVCINNVNFDIDKVNYDLVKSKEIYGESGFEGSSRIIRNNEFIITPDYPERILGNKLSTISNVELLDMLKIRINYMTNPLETFVFENNVIDVYVLELYNYYDFNKQDITYNNNIITADFLRSSSNDYYGSFLCLSTWMNPAAVESTHRVPETVTQLSRTMIGNEITIKNENNIDNILPTDPHPDARKSIAIISGTSDYISLVNVRDNIFNVANLKYIYADRMKQINEGHGTSRIGNMTLNFDNNTVTNKPEGPVNKKDVANDNIEVFHSFTGNTGSVFIGSD